MQIKPQITLPYQMRGSAIRLQRLTFWPLQPVIVMLAIYPAHR